MKKYYYLLFSFITVIIIGLFLAKCSKDEPEKPKNDVWDIEKDGVPKFVNTNYIELDKIEKISKYRSSVGHDYSDAYEKCRSMKHYFSPKSTIDWTSVKVFSPVTGIITRVEQEWTGTKLEIASDDYPAFRFSVFHINPIKTFSVDDHVIAGEILGNHIGTQTMSDISVIVNDPTRQGRMVSYFYTLTDAVFNQYKALGVNDREELIISKALRDANPLTCNGDVFTSTDTLQNWIYLK